ncbi:invasin [Ferrimonas pelagia]|uniref:Invasin n=1 Tax=Ferrimonas pelagia TaxID=1177826 RepID=A0ABP9FPD5_9GAMM
MGCFYRLFFALFGMVMLAACSGGGSLDSSGSDLGDGGDTGSGGDSYQISVVLLDANEQGATQVTTEQPLQVKATLQGPTSAQQVLMFSLSGPGALSVDSKLTDGNGVAEVQLIAGALSGAGTLTVTFESESESYVGSVNYEVMAGAIGVPTISLELYDLQGEPIQIVSQDEPGKLQANVTLDGEPLPDQFVAFSVDPVGVINPSLGTAISDSSGAAHVTLLPGEQAGGSMATARFSYDGKDYTDSFAFTTAGDAPPQSGSDGNMLTVELLDSIAGSAISTISADQPGFIRVTLKDNQQQVLAGEVVSFTSTLGNLLPAFGTALTDSNGVATMALEAGSIEGAGEVTANYRGTEESLGFITLGDVIDPDTLVPHIAFDIYDCHQAPGWDRTLRNFSACETTDNITNTESGVIGVTVTQAGGSQPLQQALVLGVTTLGGISPTAGTAVTNSDGVAILDLYANGDVGAGEITVSTGGQSATKAFEIGRVDVKLALATTIGDSVLPAGGTTVVTVEVLNQDDTPALGQPFEIELGSDCLFAGSAVIDSPVSTIAGVAQATYRAMGCSGTDTITATALTGGTTVSNATTIEVADAGVGSIQYVSVSEKLLALKGSGGIAGTGQRTESSVVTFKLLDSSGAAVENALVCFELATDVGGITLFPDPTAAELSHCSNIQGTALGKYGYGYSNGDGEVFATVNAGSVPTPVKVFAMWTDGTDIISNVSDEMVISTGLADQNSFSVSVSLFNPEGWSHDNELVSVNALAADHFNNPVPDGTIVSFWAEGGAVDASCETGPKDARPNPLGGCSVEWRSQNPRPFVEARGQVVSDEICRNPDNLGSIAPPCLVDGGSGSYVPEAIDEPRYGRATVLAYAIGEESFVDLNGNGQFDSAELSTVTDLSEAFRDDNEDGQFRDHDVDGVNPSGLVPAGAINEEFVDFNRDGSFNGKDGLYTGLLCHEDSTADCVDTGVDGGYAQIDVRRSVTIVMSGSWPYGKLTRDGLVLDGSDEVDLTTATGDPSQTLRLYLTDLNNNPLPFGTTIEATTSNGELSVGSSYTFPNIATMTPLAFVFVLERETTPNEKTDGTLLITVQTPKGSPRTFTLAVRDDG